MSHLQTDIKAFYLPAIPSIYRSPRFLNQDSFFLHTEQDLPTNFSDLSSAESVQSRHFKLAAFRHVRHLRFGEPRSVGPSGALYSLMLKAERESLETLAHAERMRVRERAKESIGHLQAGVMPMLEVIQVGEIQYDRSDMDRGVSEKYAEARSFEVETA